MGVPEGVSSRTSACGEASHNSLPHIAGGIDAHLFAMTLDSVDGLSEEVAVSSVIRSPSATSAWIGLNIYPYGSVEVRGDSSDHLIDLGGS